MTMLAVIAPYTAVFAAALTAAFALYWNFRNAKAARRLPFLERQLDLCFEAAKVGSRLATLDDMEQWKAERQRFFELYFGELAIVEDQAVTHAMMELKDEIDSVTDDLHPPFCRRPVLVLKLSDALRSLVIRTWKIKDIEEILSR
jgi:hypothetical protein